MRRHPFLAFLALTGAATLTAACMAGVPLPPVAQTQPPDSALVRAGEHAATIVALRPPKRRRPVIAVLGQNDGTETTDYLVPYGVLTRSGLAEVLALAIAPGPLQLHPALTIQPQATTADFDARYPEGADYVVVPAMHHADDAAVLAWIRAQAVRGATIVGVCSGAKVLSNAGLLRDRAATGHWYDIDGLRKENPSMRWVRDRRYVADRGVVTTTGITASLPVSLALVEAIGGRDAAAALARELGVASWDESHDSDAFRLRRQFLLAAARNKLAFWSHETVGIPVENGVDEIALAFTADAYSRTYRSRALTIGHGAPVTTRGGLRLVPDRTTEEARPDALLAMANERPARALDAALDGIAERYGAGTAAFVALQLEYQRRPALPGAR